MENIAGAIEVTLKEEITTVEDIPDFIKFGDLCRITGLSGYDARRFMDRYQIEYTACGTAKFMETKSTLQKMAAVPEMYHKMNEQGKELMRQLRAQELEPQCAD